jgi:hypothetical protein
VGIRESSLMDTGNARSDPKGTLEIDTRSISRVSVSSGNADSHGSIGRELTV